MAGAEINVGLLLALSPATREAPMRTFLQRVVGLAQPELERATRARWSFGTPELTRLSSDDARRPSDLLDEASLLMVEGPYDLVVVVTDVGLISRKRALRAALHSRVGRVAVVSMRRLLATPRGQASRTLDDESVAANAAGLVLHQVGHLLGLGHSRGGDGAMAPFRFREGLRAAPRFDARDEARLPRLAEGAPEREIVERGQARRLLFHATSGARHARLVLGTLLRNRAPLLALRLPSLTTAALVPSFLLIFTAEIWDVGLNLSEPVAWAFAGASLVAATGYLLHAQNLFYPQKEKRLVTEHVAVVNVAIFLTVLLALIGLFAMVGLVMLLIEVYVFPSGLIATWPTLNDPEVTFGDKVRLAGFVSTVALLTGALAGALEPRTVIRHLALFQDEP